MKRPEERLAVTLPAVTRAAVFYAPGDIRVEPVPLRAPAAGEVLVRIRACGLCSGETMSWYMARKAPVGLGHEPAAEVVATGEAASATTAEAVSLVEGDRVFVHHHAPCLRCRACARGEFVHCATWRRTRLIPGALSEYALVPAEIAAVDLLPLPAGLSDEAATFVEPLACVVKAFRRAALHPGDRLAVIGLGVMGLLHVMLARAMGVERIVAADLRPERLEAAREAGADVVLPAGADLPARVGEATDGGADVVSVTPPSLEAISTGAASAAPAGRLLLFAPLPPGVPWPVPVDDLYFREVSVIPSYSAGPGDTREALRHLAAGLPVERLITHRIGLQDAPEGYRLVAEGRALKVVVLP